MKAKPYDVVFYPGHPRADPEGFVPKYVVVAEEKLGRPLYKGETVHHLDFDKTNDDPDNLLILQRSDHARIPRLQAEFIFEVLKKRDEYRTWLLERLQDTLKDEAIHLKEQILAKEAVRKRLQVRIKRTEGMNYVRQRAKEIFSSVQDDIFSGCRTLEVAP